MTTAIRNRKKVAPPLFEGPSYHDLMNGLAVLRANDEWVHESLPLGSPGRDALGDNLSLLKSLERQFLLLRTLHKPEAVSPITTDEVADVMRQWAKSRNDGKTSFSASVGSGLLIGQVHWREWWLSLLDVFGKWGHRCTMSIEVRGPLEGMMHVRIVFERMAITPDDVALLLTWDGATPLPPLLRPYAGGWVVPVCRAHLEAAGGSMQKGSDGWRSVILMIPVAL